MSVKSMIQGAFRESGIEFNGSNPWDFQVHDDRFYQRLVNEGSLGLGESYMDGWWDCEQLDELFFRLILNKHQLKRRFMEELVSHFNSRLLVNHALRKFAARISNKQAGKRAGQVVQKHYNLGNDLFGVMLDSRMIYSCGYWKGVYTLDRAQEAKLDLICRKLGLQPGMRLLDIGGGWGGLVRYAAENYGVECVYINLPRAIGQIGLAKEVCAGFPIDIIPKDYRTVSGRFDRIVSVGMFEHVGHKNYRTYMETVERCLVPGGLSLLHTIGGTGSGREGDQWLTKYIFPNSVLPSRGQIMKAAKGLFHIWDWHEFGNDKEEHDYAKTLKSWEKNFELAWREDKSGIKSKYGHLIDGKFYRMWKYYLASCRGAFLARDIHLWQILLSRNDTPAEYAPLR